MSHRLLATVSGLTIGDYLLWNWSLNANHDVLELVSGLTLPPLAVACTWLLALTAARLIARSSRGGRRTRSTARVPAPTARPRWRRRRVTRRPLGGAAIDQVQAASTTSQRSSRKIAA